MANWRQTCDYSVRNDEILEASREGGEGDSREVQHRSGQRYFPVTEHFEEDAVEEAGQEAERSVQVDNERALCR